jgi:hypothetical protein
MVPAKATLLASRTATTLTIIPMLMVLGLRDIFYPPSGYLVLPSFEKPFTFPESL